MEKEIVTVTVQVTLHKDDVEELKGYLNNALDADGIEISLYYKIEEGPASAEDAAEWREAYE